MPTTRKQRKKKKLKKKEKRNIWYIYRYNSDKNEISFKIPK